MTYDDGGDGEEKDGYGCFPGDFPEEMVIGTDNYTVFYVHSGKRMPIILQMIKRADLKIKQLLHYSRVMPTPDGHRYLPSTAVFLVELLKGTICLTIALYEVAASVPKSASAVTLLSAVLNAVFSGDSWKMALPAGLYTLANSLQYVAISNLDAATFHVTYQFKIIVTAVLSVMILGRSLNGRQWLSLVLLMAGVAIVSMPHDERPSLASSHHTRVYTPRSVTFIREHLLGAGPPQSGSGITKRSATYEGILEDEMYANSPMVDASAGLLAVIAVCVCSGWAGVYFEKVIKDSPTGTSLWIRNVQLSIYSMFPAFFIGVLFLDGETVAKNGFFAGYNWVVVVSIIIQSFGGIVASFCLFYADNISKTFAVSISMVLSSLVSFLFFGFEATTNFVLGSAIVLSATYLYSVQESRQHMQVQPPTIKIHENNEKPRVISPSEQNDMSIQIPRTPLAREESGLTTSRPGSPSHKKRKNEYPGYFTKVHH